MSRIGYGYGSEWHMLRYLGYHSGDLTSAIHAMTGGEGIDWMAAPYAKNPKPLGDDGEWNGVDFEEPDVCQLWRTYWPATGSAQSWDAIGTIRSARGHERLLVEAKAHTGEMMSVCKASAASAKMISIALSRTALNVTSNKITTDAWTTKYYQYANRIAVLNFLMHECSPAIPARLVFLYFYGERRSKMKGCNCPATEGDWRRYLQDVHTQLDIDERSPLMRRIHHVFLPVSPHQRMRV